MRGRSFIKELDFTPEEWLGLMDLADELKAARRSGFQSKHLVDKNIALIFEKTSTRTRCSFEVAAHLEGAQVTYLDPLGSQIGHKESVKDTARVLGRMFDGLQYRGAAQSSADRLAEFSGVPVWNGLTDDWHPTQSLCDLVTMREHSDKPLSEISYAFLGDARNNVGNSLLAAGALMGMDVRMVAPPKQQTSPEILSAARDLASRTGARILVTDDISEGVRGVDFVHTDVWVSMGEPKEIWEERIDLLRDYQVNADLMARTGNPDVKFMHCLPAFHDRETQVGEEVYRLFGIDGGIEVTDEVFESPASIVFDQAENRMHTIRAVMVATLGSSSS
nr:ornithine carbamoyltransferase [Arsenicicoccus piscis]